MVVLEIGENLFEKGKLEDQKQKQIKLKTCVMESVNTFQLCPLLIKLRYNLYV